MKSAVTAGDHWTHAGPRTRWLAGVLFWFLLGGYLIFNKPFALLGYPPLYIGEVVLAFVVLATLDSFNQAYLNRITQSWTLRLIALFLAYGVLRVFTGFFYNPFYAIRDGATVGYALLVFIAPVAWANAGSLLVKPRADRKTLPIPRDDLPASIAHVVSILSVPAAIWAGFIQFGTVKPPAELKVDFLTMSTAVACWVWFMAAIKYNPVPSPATSRTKSVAFCLGSLGISWLAFKLLLMLPTRAVWLSAAPLSLAVILALCRGSRVWLWSLGVLVALVVLAGAYKTRSFLEVENEYALNRDLNFSINKVETDLAAAPEVLPKFKFEEATSGTSEEEQGERLMSLMNPNADQLHTRQGMVGREAVRWRAAFWIRCYDYTMENSPFFGIGFGNNLTNLLRNTAAWPLFIPSMSVGNRSPHSAHVTILTRLGLVGLLLWFAILASVSIGALRTCWHHSALAANEESAELKTVHRRRFWDGLTVFGLWIIYLWSMSFGVVLEGPMGGMWFWSLTGVLAYWEFIPKRASVEELALHQPGQKSFPLRGWRDRQEIHR